MARRTRSRSNWGPFWAVLLALTIFGIGCSWLPSPGPPEPPGDPEPQCATFTDRGGTLRPLDGACDCYIGQDFVECPEWECEINLPYCHETTPPMTCGPCVHNPTGTPEHCEKAPDCAEPPPPPPPPDPLPIPGCFFPPDHDGRWVSHTAGNTGFYTKYKEAVLTVGDRCGEDFDESLALIAEELRNLGLCAKGPAADSVSIQRGNTKWYEEWHAVYYGVDHNTGLTGCTINGRGAYKTLWEWTGPMNTPPPPPPPSDCPVVPDSCGEVIKLQKHNGYWDSSYNVTSCCEHCKSIGYCCMPNSPTNDCDDPACTRRCGCPILPEGHPARPACEAELLDQQWWCDGAPIPHRGNNPAQANCLGHVKTCSADGRVCNEADW